MSWKLPGMSRKRNKFSQNEGEEDDDDDDGNTQDHSTLATHLIPQKVSLDREARHRLLFETAHIKPRIQEIVGATKSMKEYNGRYIYRLAIDFDCTPECAVPYDKLKTWIGSAVAKLSRNVFGLDKLLFQEAQGGREGASDAADGNKTWTVIVTSKMRSSGIRGWHVHFTDVVVVHPSYANAGVLRTIKSRLRLALGGASNELDNVIDWNAGSSQWMVYGSRKAYSNESAVETEAYRLWSVCKFGMFSGELQDEQVRAPDEQEDVLTLRSILSMHKPIDIRTDTVFDASTQDITVNRSQPTLPYKKSAAVVNREKIIMSSRRGEDCAEMRRDSYKSRGISETSPLSQCSRFGVSDAPCSPYSDHPDLIDIESACGMKFFSDEEDAEAEKKKDANETEDATKNVVEPEDAKMDLSDGGEEAEEGGGEGSGDEKKKENRDYGDDAAAADDEGGSDMPAPSLRRDDEGGSDMPAPSLRRRPHSPAFSIASMQSFASTTFMSRGRGDATAVVGIPPTPDGGDYDILCAPISGPVVNSMEQCIALAEKWPGTIKCSDGKMASIRREVFMLAIDMMTTKYNYATDYHLWFTKLTPLIASNFSYREGLLYYMHICALRGGKHMRDSPRRHYDKCVKYLWSKSGDNAAPRKIYRLHQCEPFVLEAGDRATARWVDTTLSEKCHNFYPVVVEYILELVQKGVVQAVYNTCNNSYDMVVYSEKRGVYQKESLMRIIEALINVVHKLCVHQLSSSTPGGPLSVMHHFFHDLIRFVQHPTRIDSLDLQKRDRRLDNMTTGHLHLVFSNGQTYYPREGIFRPWHMSQVCTMRSELDPNLGIDETYSVVTVKIMPCRGGLQYRSKHAQKLVRAAHQLYMSTDKFRFAYERVYALASKQVEREMLCDSYSGDCDSSDCDSSDCDSIDCDEGGDAAGVVEDISLEAYTYRVMQQAVVNMINQNPASYTEIFSQSSVFNSMVCSSELDDGGPVVFEKTELSWEEVVWKTLDDIFGDRETTLMVLRFIARGLSAERQGRYLMFMHGPAMNGKSHVIGLVRNLFGTDNTLVKTLESDYFGKRTQMDAQFRSDGSSEIRFLIVNEMPVLEMGHQGKLILKQFTGGDVMTARAPFAYTNREFTNNAKIITSSNDIPYFNEAEQAEISRFWIVHALTLFRPGIADVRNHFMTEIAQDLCRRKLFGQAYPAMYIDYVKDFNLAANTFFYSDKNATSVTAPLFRANMVPIFGFTRQPAVVDFKSMPSMRVMLADPKLMSKDYTLRQSAALMRILTREIVPQMLAHEEPDNNLDTLVFSYINDHKPLYESYKNPFLIVLRMSVVHVPDQTKCVCVKKLRLVMQQHFEVFRRSELDRIYGTCTGTSGVGSKTENPLVTETANALKSMGTLVKALQIHGINVETNGTDNDQDSSNAFGPSDKIMRGYMFMSEYQTLLDEENVNPITGIVDDSDLLHYGVDGDDPATVAEYDNKHVFFGCDARTTSGRASRLAKQTMDRYVETKIKLTTARSMLRVLQKSKKTRLSRIRTEQQVKEIAELEMELQKLGVRATT